MAEGVQIKIATDAAVEAQKKLDGATKATFVSLEQQNTKIVQLEEQLAKMGDGSKAATDATKQLARSSGDTAGAVGKLLGAAGQGGAAKGLGLLSSATKAVIAGLNPMGLATGLAASALVGLASASSFSGSDLGRLVDRVAVANRSFDILNSTASRSAQLLSGLADASRQGLGTTDIEKYRELTAQLDRQRAAVAGLRAQYEKTPDLRLGIEQAADLAEVLGLPAKAYRDLDIAAKGAGAAQAKAISDLAQAGIVLRQSPKLDSMGFSDGTVTTLALADAMRALDTAISRTQDGVGTLGEKLAGTTAPFDALTRATESLATADAMGAREREVHARVVEELSKRMGPLTQAQEDSIRTAYETAIAYDKATAATKKLDEAGRRRAQNDDQRSEILRQLNDDAEVLLATGEKEIRQKQRQAKLNDLLARTETERGSEDGMAIEAAVMRVEEAEKLSEKLAEVRQVGADAGAIIGQGFLDAARGGESLRQSIGSIAEQLSQLAAKKLVVDLLVKLGSAIASGIGGAFGGAPAGDPIGPRQSNGSFARGGFLPSAQGPTGAARGMLLDRYQTFTYNGSRVTTNEGGAATPEAIVPLARDEFGRLGVMQAGGGGGNITVNVPNVRTAADARAIRPTIRHMIDSVARPQRRGLRGGR